jgi:hypothetical protein
MAKRASRKRLTVAAGMLLTTGMMGATVLYAASPAMALGNNRTVSRSCGTTYVASGYSSSQRLNWAQTEKRSGDCTGRLSAALIKNNGYQTARHYGTSSRAYTSYTEGVRAINGLHWGCDSCNVTYS